MKNYYRILDIHGDASPEEIKSAYRRKAKELHPDYYGENREPFQSLQEAYAHLSDPDRRKAHDDALAQEQRSYMSQRNPARVTRYQHIEPLIPDRSQQNIEELLPSRPQRRRSAEVRDLFELLQEIFERRL
ncbi:chaperone protein DnaJ [Candidatus Moduliflexus flocculans]|uniref:Chaperone protein DnaJ n=1 Tax=Candidatus Moduliflexus flocculans TaxID=1499966 RepID=A0A0S6VTP0_9BACT|nr:chaperone protein DnaJ [Candidatus Moduliflexus flocculans]